MANMNMCVGTPAQPTMRETIDSIYDYVNEATLLAAQLNSTVMGPKMCIKAEAPKDTPAGQLGKLEEIKGMLIELCATMRDTAEKVGV